MRPARIMGTVFGLPARSPILQKKKDSRTRPLWYNMDVHTRLEWTHPPKGGDAMNISFGEVLTFGIFLLALLTYIDKRK
ncbi:hypothetical protein J2TS6_29840 [Paenibacillus albilobatus]|uniref:Uncharacterized protein n=1 Tax=Paenibacillus albilobatus TaxID=2716884 RepID=A0A920CBF2_9BACL|nr:hypothetical protein J2TS6_29840 [Paenibacillus albilobatus]